MVLTGFMDRHPPTPMHDQFHFHILGETSTGALCPPSNASNHHRHSVDYLERPDSLWMYIWPAHVRASANPHTWSIPRECERSHFLPGKGRSGGRPEFRYAPIQTWMMNRVVKSFYSFLLTRLKTYAWKQGALIAHNSSATPTAPSLLWSAEAPVCSQGNRAVWMPDSGGLVVLINSPVSQLFFP